MQFSPNDGAKPLAGLANPIAGRNLKIMKKVMAVGVVLGTVAWAAIVEAATNSATADDPLSSMVATVTNRWRLQAAPPTEAPLAGDVTAKHVLFCQTRWESKVADQVINFLREQEQMRLPEAERLKVMNRLDDFSEMWFVRVADHPNAGPALKAAIHPGSQTNQYYRELAHLGSVQGYACYAFMPIYEWAGIQRLLNCQGGDDPLAAAVRGLSVDDRGTMTANSCSDILAAAGGKAVPYLKPLLGTPNSSQAVRSLIYNQSTEATELLLECAKSANPDLARQAKHYLSALPRAAAVELYFHWLAEDAGRTSVLYLLEACARFDKPRLAPFLPRVLASPSSAHELRRAFELSRSLVGQEIPARLIAAEAIIRKFNPRSTNGPTQQDFEAAVTELTQAEDAEAAACIGVSLAVATGKGLPSQVNPAGISILQQLPNHQGRDMAKALYNSSADDNVKRRLKEVVEE